MPNESFHHGKRNLAPPEQPLWTSIIVRLPTLVAWWLEDEAAHHGMSQSAMAADILLYRKTQQANEPPSVLDVAVAPSPSVPEARPSPEAVRRRRQRRRKH